MPIEDLLHPLVGAYTRSPQWLKSSLGGVYAHLPVAWRYGARYGEFEAETRLVDPQAFNPKTIMPGYYKTKGLNLVLGEFRDRPIYSAQQIEDVVSYLAQMTEEQR